MFGEHTLRQRFVLAILLIATALVVAVSSYSFVNRVQGFRTGGVDFELSPEGWRVVALATTSPLRVGDHLVLIDGTEIHARMDPEALLATGEAVERELVVIRDGEIRSLSHKIPAPSPDVPYLLLSFVAVGHLAIGLYTLFRGVDRQTVLFHLWCLCSAGLYAVSSQIPFRGDEDRLYYAIDQAFRLILPPLTLHFFLVFPRPLARLERRSSWLIPLLYAPPVALMAYLADQMLANGRLFAGAPTAWSIRVLDRVELALIATYLIAAVLSLVIQSLRSEPRREERQLLWIALGLTIGYLPFLALEALPYAAGIETSAAIRSLAVAPLFLVPLSFAWAILRYRLWDISVILRDFATYGLTLLVGGIGFAVLNVLVQSGIPDDLGMMRGVTTVAGGLLIAGLLLPAKSSIGATLERLHYGGTLARRRALGRLGDELLLERDLEPLCRNLLVQLEEAFSLDRSNLYLVQGEYLRAVQNEDGSSGHFDESALRRTEVDSRLWNNEHYHLEGAGLPTVGASTERQLFARGYRTVFPLTLRSRHIGLLAVGHKENGASLSSDDALLVRQLLNQAALAIENAQLIERMQRQLEEVVELKQFNEEIIESSPAGIAVLDGNRRVRTCNLAFAALLGFDRAALKNRPLRDAAPELKIPDADSSVIDTEFTDAAGRRRQLQISAAGLLGDRRQRMQVLVINDTTEISEMERALQEKERLAAIGLMAAGVAHEVNTPLTGISSYAQMLLGSTPNDDPRHELLRKVERQTVRASSIVNRLLDFSRAARPQTEPISLVEAWRDAVDLLDTKLESSGVQIQWEGAGPEDDPLLVRASNGELQQIATNLVMNAAEALQEVPATQKRLITIRCRCDGRQACVEVADNGPGIDTELLPRIFHPFVSTKTDRGGTGLGLAISYEITRRYDGSLTAENLPEGKGCRFLLSLPVAHTDHRLSDQEVVH